MEATFQTQTALLFSCTSSGFVRQKAGFGDFIQNLDSLVKLVHDEATKRLQLTLTE